MPRPVEHVTEEINQRVYQVGVLVINAITAVCPHVDALTALGEELKNARAIEAAVSAVKPEPAVVAPKPVVTNRKKRR
jgi:SepF-like predicted cell division protein (DUF552 family)